MFAIITLNDLDLLGFQSHPMLNIVINLLFVSLMLALLHLSITKQFCKIFLLDFVCYQPPEALMCSTERLVEKAKLSGFYSEETLDFMKKIIERSGLGDSTYMAEALLTEPPCPSLEHATKEAEMVIFGTIDILLKTTGVNCKDIAILVVNCCIFNVVPSLSSMIVNHYKLRDNIVSYNLSGMGCSAGLRAIGLAKELLQNITENCYLGNVRSKVLTNCLFRVGGVSILLSNRPSDQRLSKYQLLQTVHAQTSSSDRSYNCIFQEDDQEGKVGVNINKDLLAAAITTIELNLTSLGYLILPLSEKIIFLTNYILRQLHFPKIQPYIPHFSKAVNHFVPHVGGKPVLDELQRSLGFSDADMEASRMTLYRFGNTSSSSIWYAMAYTEAKGRIKKGDRVWQIAFGSGFKCSSAIWKATRTVNNEETNPWSKEIGGFPIELYNNGSFPYFFEPSK